MGNDGGSIPKRRELVKEATRAQTVSEAKESLQEQQEYCWTTCPLSQQPLKEPVVSDWIGNLYNKDAVIEYLLPAEDEAGMASKADKAKLLDGRIKSLKDIQEVKFHIDRHGDTKTGAHFERRWSCPVTSKALGPGVKAVYLIPCGHAFEEAAVRNVSEGRCLQCEEPFDPDNVIPILPIAAKERDRLASRAMSLKNQGLTHALKKASGKKRKKGPTDNGPDEVSDAKSKTAKASNYGKTMQLRDVNIKNASTASLAAKVQAELDENTKRRRMEPNDNIQGLYRKEGKGSVSNRDFMTRGFTMTNASKQ